MEEKEFDKFADEYYATLNRSLGASGETADFFAEYKIKDVAEHLQAEGASPRTILDFGSGVGNSLPYFRKYFPSARVTCADISERSLDVSRLRYPGREHYVKIAHDGLPVDPASFDLVFSACVFHHIEDTGHVHWLAELHRVARADGHLFIFEHNPFNPLTRSVVRHCPFDENAKLITAATFRRRIGRANWSRVEVRYRLFFPHALAKFRTFERYLYRVPLGAQYYVHAQK